MITKHKILTDEDIDRKLSLCISIQFLIQVINYCLKQGLGIYNSSLRQSISFILMLCMGGFFIKNIKYVIKRNPIFFISIYLIFTSVFLGSILINKVIIEYISGKAFWLLFVCLPVCVFIYSIKSFEYLYLYLNSVSYISIILIFITYVNIFRNSNLRYDMTISYLLLLPVLFLINKLFKLFSVNDFILAFLGTLIIIITGSRGPLLCIAILIIILLIFNFKNINKFKVLTIISLALMITYTKDILLGKMRYILYSLGIRSRTIELLVSDKVSNLTGRDVVYDSTLELISRKPLFGYGVAAEVKYFDGFPHNIILELCMNYGVIVGGLLIFFILLLFYKCIINKDFYTRNLSIIFFSSGFIPLLVSGSYLTKQEFWVFIGIGLVAIKKKKKKG